MGQDLRSLLRSGGTGRRLRAAGLLLLFIAVFAALGKSWGAAAFAAVLALALLTVGALTTDKLSRVLVAFALAPLAPAVAVLVQSGPQSAFLVAPYAYFFSMFSVPVYLLLRSRRWLRFWQVVAASAVLGALAGFFVASGEGRAYERLLFAGYGALTGTVFWIIALLGAPGVAGSSSARSEHNAA